MLCPKDKAACNTKTLEDITIDVCPVCDGVWIEQSEVKNLVRHLSIPGISQMDELLEEWEVLEHEGTPPKDFWAEDDLVCPQDGNGMKKHYFAGGHVGVDQCHECMGFWLDGGELHAIAEIAGPDPVQDRFWQMFIRSDNEWRKKMEDAKFLPAKIGLLLMNPKYVILVLGSFVVKMIVDHIERNAE